jgi:sec-independent protein translocase protein TatA
MFGDIGFTEILIVVLVILIFFGAKKIPEIAQGFGKGIKEFKKAVKDGGEEEKKKPDDSNSGKK